MVVCVHNCAGCVFSVWFCPGLFSLCTSWHVPRPWKLPLRTQCTSSAASWWDTHTALARQSDIIIITPLPSLQSRHVQFWEEDNLYRTNNNLLLDPDSVAKPLKGGQIFHNEQDLASFNGFHFMLLSILYYFKKLLLASHNCTLCAVTSPVAGWAGSDWHGPLSLPQHPPLLEDLLPAPNLTWPTLCSGSVPGTGCGLLPPVLQPAHPDCHLHTRRQTCSLPQGCLQLVAIVQPLLFLLLPIIPDALKLSLNIKMFHVCLYNYIIASWFLFTYCLKNVHAVYCVVAVLLHHCL